MPALLLIFLMATVAIHPKFDSFDAQSLAMAALPLACAAAAQAIVVISGGIDLSIGSVIAVANVLAARTMTEASFGQALWLALAILVAGAAIGAVNGLLVIVSRVPDVIVTLTTGFIWGGVALLILEKPGGGGPSRVCKSWHWNADHRVAVQLARSACRSRSAHMDSGSHVEGRPAHLRHRQ